MKFKNTTEQQEFEKWAFGESEVNYSLPIMHSWNSRHGEELWLTENGIIEHDLPKMFALWEKSKEYSNNFKKD